MISQRKLEANRRNALRSTGPRTAEGKAASRMNALRHGAWSERALEPATDPRGFGLHRRAMLRRLRPRGEEERNLPEEAVLQGWRLQRFHEMEEGLYRRDQSEAVEALDREGPLPPPGRARELAFSIALGEVLGRTMSGPGNPYQTLARQEARALRTYTRCLADLRRLQGMRRAAQQSCVCPSLGPRVQSPTLRPPIALRAEAVPRVRREEKSAGTNPPLGGGLFPSQGIVKPRTSVLPAALPHTSRNAQNEPTGAGAILRPAQRVIENNGLTAALRTAQAPSQGAIEAVLGATTCMKMDYA